jgi:hypothetical protein
MWSRVVWQMFNDHKKNVLPPSSGQKGKKMEAAHFSEILKLVKNAGYEALTSSAVL